MMPQSRLSGVSTGGSGGIEKSFWSFFNKSEAAAETAAEQAAATAPRIDALVVPREAPVHGGDPILILLPDGKALAPGRRYCLVYEGSNRRHVASCELVPDCRALFSRVPEHDSPESVSLSVHAQTETGSVGGGGGGSFDSAPAPPLLSGLQFAFSPDPMARVAAAIAAVFPAVPDAFLSGDGGDGGGSDEWPPDADRRLSEALRRLDIREPPPMADSGSGSDCGSGSDSGIGTESGSGGGDTPGSSVLHWLATHGWLETLAQLLHRSGRPPETWLDTGPAPSLRQLMSADRRCRPALTSPERLRLWLRQLAGGGAGGSPQEDAVVRVFSWRTPAATALVVMTTNLAKAATPLEQDLAVFPGLETCHAQELFQLRDPSCSYDAGDEPRETACSQTEIGGSLEELARFCSAADAPHDDPQPGSGPDQPLATTTPPTAVAIVVSASSSASSVGCGGPRGGDPSTSLSADGRSLSTPTLYADLMSEQQQSRKKRRSFLSRLGSSYRTKQKQQASPQQSASSCQRSASVADHDWVMVTSGSCAVCEADNERGCRLLCRVCQLTVHSCVECRGRTVSCLPTVAEAPLATIAAGSTEEAAMALEVLRGKKKLGTSPGPEAASAAAASAGPANPRPGAGASESPAALAASSNGLACSTVPQTRQPPQPLIDPVSCSELEALALELASRAASWADAQERKLVKRQCGDKLARRCNFVYELVSTELSHLRNLRVLQAIFREPLLRWSITAAASTAVDIRREIEALFPQLDALERLHRQFLADLRRCEPPRLQAGVDPDWSSLAGLGGVICGHLSGPPSVDWLEAYGGFCSEHTVSLQPAIAGLGSRWPEFTSFLRECERSPHAGRKTLQDLYLTVTQRLSKYKTLFPQICDCCVGHQSAQPDDPNMPAACAALNSLMDAVNAHIECRHNQHLLAVISAGLQTPTAGDSGGSSGGVSISMERVLTGKRLVHSGRLLVQTNDAKAPVTSFAVLLNDSLLFLQELPAGRYAPLASPVRHLPLIRFAETDVIVREHESGKAGRGGATSFFLIVKQPDPTTLITLSCHSLEDRGKWLRLINQVRDSNPRADERALKAELELRRKATASADLLSGMERRDRDLLALLNEKGQLWRQLLRLWGCQEVVGVAAEPPSADDEASKAAVSTEPERLCREALTELARMRRLLRCFSGYEVASDVAAASGDAAIMDEDAAAASLKRSSSSAEEKSAAAVSLPKRADTFSGCDAARRSTRRPQLQPQQSQTLPYPQSPPPQQQTGNETGGVVLREREPRESKSRRPSMFEIFRRPRDSATSAVLVEDPAAAQSSPTLSDSLEPTLRSTPPDAESLETLGRLQDLVNAMATALLCERSRLAGRVQAEAELRQEVQGLRSSRDQESFRSQDSILERIRIQRAELEQDRARFRDERLRETARMETRAEDLERREDQLRQHLEDLDRQAAGLEDQRRLLKLQADRLETFLAAAPPTQITQAPPLQQPQLQQPQQSAKSLALRARAAAAFASASSASGGHRRNGDAAAAAAASSVAAVALAESKQQQLQQTS